MIYVYYCENCEVEFEEEHSMTSVPSEGVCPHCGCLARKVILAPTVHYKGFGWTGAGHGIPDMDEREDIPKPWQFDDLMEDAP